jgi:hypothetical protein
MWFFICLINIIIPCVLLRSVMASLLKNQIYPAIYSVHGTGMCTPKNEIKDMAFKRL